MQWNKDLKQVSSESVLRWYLHEVFILPFPRPLAVLSPLSRVFGSGQSAPVEECVFRLPWGSVCCPQTEGQFGVAVVSPEPT